MKKRELRRKEGKRGKKELEEAWDEEKVEKRGTEKKGTRKDKNG